MEADEEKLLRQYAKAALLVTRERDAENEAKKRRCNAESNMQSIAYKLTGLSAARLVSDVLFLVIRQLTQGHDLRSFCLTCTHWNQSFADNLSVFTNASQLWGVQRSVKSIRPHEPYFPDLAFVFGVTNYDELCTVKYGASGRIHSILRSPFRFSPTNQGLWTKACASDPLTHFAIRFPDGTRFVYQEYIQRNSNEYRIFPSHRKDELIMQVFSSYNLGLCTKWQSAQADLMWSTVIRDVSDFILARKVFCLGWNDTGEIRNPLLGGALKFWRSIHENATI